jgi:hypothetical protein
MHRQIVYLFLLNAMCYWYGMACTDTAHINGTDTNPEGWDTNPVSGKNHLGTLSKSESSGRRYLSIFGGVDSESVGPVPVVS